MSPSPLPGVSPIVATSKSSTQSSIQQSSQNHNLSIPSTSYGLTPSLNNIQKTTLIGQQQQKNIILQPPPKMIVQNDKNSDISDNSSIGSNINNNIPEIISAKETITTLPPPPPTTSSSGDSLLLNKIPSSVNNTSHLIKNDNQQEEKQHKNHITNNNNNEELNGKNQLISDIKIKEEKDKQNTSSSSSTSSSKDTTTTTIVDKQKNDKNDDDEEEDNKKKNDEKSIVFDVSKKREIFLKNLNKHIICNLCQGYLIDATTIVECLHSFCHSCIMKHLRTEQYCPRCEMMINTAKPNIKPDTTLQAIVYKIVPGLYEKELMRKRAFYRDRPEDAAIATPEQRGEDTEHLIFSPTEKMSLSLEYADIKEIPYGSDDIYGLKTPKYLQCPASLTVAHLKKFVLMKFAIDSELFMVEIMYKVKTIVLYDHYTLMDVAYIYTWKRDAPMRFFFRVKETDNYTIKLEKLKRRNLINKNENNSIVNKEIISTTTKFNSNNVESQIEKLDETKIKTEPSETNNNNKLVYDSNKQFEIVQNTKKMYAKNSEKTEKIKITLVGKNKYPKITSPNQQLITKNNLMLSTKLSNQQQQKSIKSNIKNSELIYNQSNNNNDISSTTTVNCISNNEQQTGLRKLENIKMKIDMSKQDSIKIINMSGPDSMPKEIVKSVKPEKEWKIKIKKDDKHSTSPKSSSSSSSPKDSDNNRKRKSLSPLTVPPITIKAEKLSPIPKTNTKLSPIPKDDDSSSSSKVIIGEKDEEEKKSEFLNSFALTPIKNISPEKQIKIKSNNLPEIKVVPTKNLMGPPLKPVTISKRKNKEPIKSLSKKQKFDFADMLTPANFTKKKINKDIGKQQLSSSSPKEMISFGLAPYPIGGSSNPSNNNSNCDVLINGKPLHKFNNDDKLMPAPPPLKVLDAAKKNGIKSQKQQNNNEINNKNIKIPMSIKHNNNINKTMQRNHNISQPGSTTPHPMIPSGIASSKAAMAAPGNRTPITKRYPTILPKQTITNPFANIPSEVNKILQDSGTEIKHISPNEDGTNSVKVYGPSMNITNNNTSKLPNNQLSQQIPSNLNKNNINKTSVNNQSYLNYALYNSSKTRGNEVPPGCRTPMYAPNSPIYSPNSPQYISNYNIPIQPTYKYAPKSTSNVNSYLQNVLSGQNKQMSGLFPGPPVQKSDDNHKKSPPIINNYDIDMKNGQNENNKLNYPFSKTPPNDNKNKNEPEKQIKVKSLLTSCNINIPSSLSITITNEDSDSKSNNLLNPKHKSPVNNYIEILKLPDQTLQEQNNNDNNNKNDQQQQQQTQIKDDTTPTKKKDIELSNISSNNNNNCNKIINNNTSSSGNTKTVMTMNTPRSSPMPFGNSTIKTTNSSSTNLCPTTTNAITTSAMNITNKSIGSLNTNDKKLIEQPKKSPSEITPKENKLINKNDNKNNLTTVNKKTPSPDKKSPTTINENKKRTNSDKKTSPENGQKLTKNDINQQQQQPPAKKFRHILPRTPTTQQQQQNITNNNKQIISSPTTTTTTTSPKQITKNLLIQQQIPQQQQQQIQKQSPTNLVSIRTNFPNTSNGCIVGIKTNQQIPTTTNKTNNNNLKKNDNNNFINNLIKSPITSTHQQTQQLPPQQQQQSINLNNTNNIIDNIQPINVTNSSNNINNNNNNIQRPISTDMTNFFNETILRAAAAANAANVAAVNNTNVNNCTTNTNSSNIFLPHLAAAANFGQYAPINFNPYNFQQAVLQQYARYNLEKLAQNFKNNNNNNNNNNHNINNNKNSPKGIIQTTPTSIATAAATTLLNGGNSGVVVSDGITGTTGTKEKTV